MYNNSSTRLNKYISESGICSRRDADRFVEQGNVYINGKRASVGDQVAAGDVVKVNGQLIEPREPDDFIFIALNKPVGIVSTTESSEKNNIVDFVRHSVRIFPIGRLDKDSQGLIFLTNNGDLVNKVLRAGNNHEKEYLVTVNKPITDSFIEGMASGVPMLGKMTKKCPVTKVAPNVFNITLIQGLNRQIRRMCEHFGYEVVKLERTRIMNVSLKGLPVGDWRDRHQQSCLSCLKLSKNPRRKTIIRAKNRAMHHEKNRVLTLNQSQNPLQNQQVLQRGAISTPRMMLENQQVLKVEMGVRPVVARMLQAMVNLLQTADVPQKVEGLSDNNCLISSHRCHSDQNDEDTTL
ncbi:MAG: 23S rRNA pseudouridine(2604) synthase RluF [Psychrobacter pacificensis]|nr:23S rRNA pseudouridine(2604) synthase RluF [Psychrobacter pacificensis]MDE0844679.1 23S rRNA pseudouridine(2604) synthase RluF [Psychrobacter pacificensis]